MTEAQHTAKWVREMRKKHPEWTIIKFNDRLTKGIPDLAIVNGTRTTWLECKRKDTPRPDLQRFYLERMGGLYLVFDIDCCWLETPDGTKLRSLVEEYLQ